MWDWMLEPTASLYHTMHALEPIHVQYDYLTGTVSVCNDFLAEQKDITVSAEVYNMDSKRLSSNSIKTDIPSDGVANDVMKVEIPSNVTPVFFIALKAKDSKGNVLSQNVYWSSTDKYEGKNTVTGPCTSGFAPLAGMKPAKPSVKVKQMPDKDGMRVWEAEVRNSSGRIAFFCQLLLADGEGKAVHATRYTDNFFTLLPGERRKVVVRTPVKDNKQFRMLFNENMQPKKTVYESAGI